MKFRRRDNMSKLNGIILALALWLAFCGMASATQLYVNESGWWRGACAFNASGTPIQGAVGAAAAGDSIYVHGGNYYENVDVDKPRLTLEGEGADVVTVTAADAGDHVFEMTVDYANISGFAVRGATDNDMAGIRLTNVDYCNISENNVYGNHRSIYLFSSSDNTLTNNTANSNDDYGIYLQSSSNNTLTNNTANSNAYGGIMLSSSSNNTLTNNTANSNNYYGGIYLFYSSNNTLTNNTANSNNHYGIYIVHSNNNMFSNNTASDNYRGIRLHSSSSNTLRATQRTRTTVTAFTCLLRATTTRSRATTLRTTATRASTC
jgi:parallel beta-helix repeat protein